MRATMNRLCYFSVYDSNWLKGSAGDVLHQVLCAVGFNLCWLMRAVARLGLKAHLRSSCWSGCLGGWSAARGHGRRVGGRGR